MGDLQMLAIDTNRWPSVTSRFEVAKLPCLVALREGQILFRIEGLTTAADVVERVRAVQ
jgi:thioredoxin-like negative regulator of GroEL